MSGIVRVYGKQQVGAFSFLIPDNMEAECEVPVAEGTTTIRFTLRFLQVPPPQGIPTNSGWENIDGVVKFTFYGMNGPFPSSFEPFRIGDVNGVGLFIQMAHQMVGTLHKVNWYVLLGGA